MNDNNAMTPYEEFMTANTLSRKPNGASVAALVLGSVGTAAAIGAWIFGPIIAKQGIAANQKAIDILASAQLQDRATTAAHQPTTLDYINLSVNPLALAGATSRATAFNMGGGTNGNVCPTPVALYQPAMPCSCNTCN